MNSEIIFRCKLCYGVYGNSSVLFSSVFILLPAFHVLTENNLFVAVRWLMNLFLYCFAMESRILRVIYKWVDYYLAFACKPGFLFCFTKNVSSEWNALRFLNISVQLMLCFWI